MLVINNVCHVHNLVIVVVLKALQVQIVVEEAIHLFHYEVLDVFELLILLLEQT